MLPGRSTADGGPGAKPASNKPKLLGAEFRSKKAAGDMKKKDKPDPYAYLPLDISTLNRR